jgi:hypothetical protein
MPNSDREAREVSNPFHDWMAAMTDQRGELDLRLTISFHVRELTDPEKAARAAREVRLMKA